mmetsp:Transcript_8204/g.14646  ORF Transcript_8204/g.14646 Transcript_8204/m.14646 type:complete len:91 (-) Transcript_8204:1675-1947(-)
MARTELVTTNPTCSHAPSPPKKCYQPTSFLSFDLCRLIDNLLGFWKWYTMKDGKRSTFKHMTHSKTDHPSQNVQNSDGLIRSEMQCAPLK